jgi:hypothetical protein
VYPAHLPPNPGFSNRSAGKRGGSLRQLRPYLPNFISVVQKARHEQAGCTTAPAPATASERAESLTGGRVTATASEQQPLPVKRSGRNSSGSFHRWGDLRAGSAVPAQLPGLVQQPSSQRLALVRHVCPHDPRRHVARQHDKQQRALMRRCLIHGLAGLPPNAQPTCAGSTAR